MPGLPGRGARLKASRGPRGLPRGTAALVPIAWGAVVWSGGEPMWVSSGGEFGRTIPTFNGAGPYVVRLRLARPHDKHTTQVVVSPGSAGYAYEFWSFRTPTDVYVTCEDLASGFSVVVFEER